MKLEESHISIQAAIVNYQSALFAVRAYTMTLNLID